MSKKIILILLSDHNSTTERIILNSLNFLKKKKNSYVIVGRKFYFKKLAKKTFVINNIKNLNDNKINFYDVGSKHLSMYNYINLITEISIDLLSKKKVSCIINMPLNKKILKNKYPGFTEFFANKIGQSGKENMLLFSDDLSVCPLTTHVSIKKVPLLIKQSKISSAVKNINYFYKNIIKKKIHIKICGLNPHAGKDLIEKYNEEKKKIIPSIKKIIKKNNNVSGPYSADTVFLNSNKNVVIGMYHDQVLTPFKIINGFNGINITIGLKYLRLSPDHGTGLDILKNIKKINNISFKYCVKFCEKYLNV